MDVAYENNGQTKAGVYDVRAKLTKGEEEKWLQATLTIHKAPLVVAADNKTVQYGADLPEFTVTYSGFVNEETVSVLGGSLGFEEMSARLPVGTYKITPKGLTADNYAIEYKQGNLTVTPQDLTGAEIANTVTEFTADLTAIELSASLQPADNVEKGVTWSLKEDSDWFILDGSQLLCPVRKSIPFDTVFPKTVTVVLTTDGVDASGDPITAEKQFTVTYRGEKYEITNERQLYDACVTNVSQKKKYILVNDIVLNAYKTWKAGVALTGGELDGDGYTVSGLDSTLCQNGFFQSIADGAVVRNLKIEGKITTNGWGGSFVGTCAGVIENCISAIEIAGNPTMYGGFVKAITGANARIENCIMTGKIVNKTENGSLEQGNAYGFIFNDTQGTAPNVIQASEKIKNCFFVSELTGRTYFGAKNTYVANGLTLEEYYSETTYVGFDREIWNIGNFSAPTLKNKNNSGTTEKPVVAITNSENSVKAGDTLQITANKTGGGTLYTDFALGYRLETPVNGINVEYTGVVSVDKSVAADTQFTVVAYARIDGTVKASKTFTVSENSVTLESEALEATYDLSKATFEFESSVSGTITTYGGNRIAASYENGQYTVQKADMPAMPTGATVTLVIESDGRFYPVNVFTVTAVITSGAQLQAINDDLNGYYVLGSDVDLSDSTDFVAIGSAPVKDTAMVQDHSYQFIEKPEVPFNGTFDGRGFAIQNLTVKKGSLVSANVTFAPDSIGIGLFGMIGTEGTVKNLAMENFSVDATNYAGIVAAYNRGRIENVLIKSGGISTAYQIGAVVCFNRGEMRNVVCLTNAEKTSGLTYKKIKFFVYNNGSSTNSAAGLQGKLYNCYCIDGLLDGGAFTNAGDSFSGALENTGIKTETELKAASLYANFDDAFWTVTDGEFPALKTQN